MVGQAARKRSMAGCQGWEHTEPCLKPGRAPSTGAESEWVKGYKKKKKGGGVGQSRKKGVQTHLKEQIGWIIIIQCLHRNCEVTARHSREDDGCEAVPW